MAREPPLHVHRNEDEWFYVLEGTVTFHVGGQDHLGTAGAFVAFPRAIPHTFSLETPAARFLVIDTPGGFEHMSERQPTTPQVPETALRAWKSPARIPAMRRLLEPISPDRCRRRHLLIRDFPEG